MESLPIAALAVIAAIPRSATAGAVHTAIGDVRACQVSSDGRITMGTAGGVAMLASDGRVERVLTALDGLPDGRVHALLGSFVGTERGVAVLENNKVVRVAGSAPVRAIATVGSDTFLGTVDKGVQRLTTSGVVDVPFAAAGPPLRSRVFALGSHGGALVVGTAAGALRLEGGKLAALANAPSGPVFALATVGDRLFLGGLSGLSSLGTTRRNESDADVRALGVLDGDLYAATFGAGLLRVGKQTTNALVVPNIDLAFTTALGGTGAHRCVGTRDGVAVTHDGKTWALHARTSLPSADIAAVAVDGARVYVGTFDRGLAVIEGGKTTRLSDPAIDPQINALAVDKGTLWIATARGLTRSKSGVHKRFTEADGLPSNDVHTVLALPQGGVLVGTSKGAAIVRDGVEPLGKKQGVTGEAVWAVAERDGELWLGTNAGLLIGKPGGKLRRLAKLTGELPDDWVTALAFDGDTAYVGTYGGGVVAIDRTTFKTRRLGGGAINAGGVKIIGGKLMVATMEGLFVADGPELQLRRVTAGVLGTDVTAVAASAEGLIVATRRGLTIGLTKTSG